MLTSYLIQKRIKRGKMIKYLELVEDPLIKKFKRKDLQLIIDQNAYHSQEDSETDPESGEKNIVIKDLKWRSSTVSISFYLLSKLLSFLISF
jgi:hypothetical protein